jgi:hypothetical protein
MLGQLNQNGYGWLDIWLGWGVQELLMQFWEGNTFD